MPETKDKSWIYQRMRGKEICFGWYQEFRILPMSFKLGLNFLNCYASAFDIWFGKEFGQWCDFNLDKRLHSEKVLFWQGYRMTIPIMKVCV